MCSNSKLFGEMIRLILMKRMFQCLILQSQVAQALWKLMNNHTWLWVEEEPDKIIGEATE
jgi:hypothetical protein